MSILSDTGRKRYALAKGKTYIAICDEKHCGRLIPATEIYTVLKWGPRKDGLTFLGLRPIKIRCNACRDRITPIPIVDKTKKITKSIKTSLLKIFEKYPKQKFATKTLVDKLKRKKKFEKTKQSEITKTLRLLKKEKLLIYKEKMWSVPKKTKRK